MGSATSIQWTDHTFNPWWGCVRVSPGCEHCYAETFAKRVGQKVWGPAKTTARREMSEAYWHGPVKWNRAAEKAGVRARVFCASMADVFEDHPQIPPLRARLFALIEATPWLDWQILTKRPENIVDMAVAKWTKGWPTNVWWGTSVEDQQRAEERIPHLLRVPGSVRFLSCEPLLGPVDVSEWLRPVAGLNRIEWVIVGGESGPGARPFHVEWARGLIAQCDAFGAACFVKQLGRDVLDSRAGPGWSQTSTLRLRDPKGGDMTEWPEDLRVRHFPVNDWLDE